MHCERVSRQSGGIETALNAVKQDLAGLERDSRARYDQFKERLSADTEAYLSITNNSRLICLVLPQNGCHINGLYRQIDECPQNAR